MPALYWLSGLTCTNQNVMQKSGLQRLAVDLSLAVVAAPDTSPRGEQVPQGPDGGWGLGHRAGFYVDATQPPWETQLPHAQLRHSGHSMGGHGALVCALRHPGRYRSVSAFAPTAHPSACPWGRKAFDAYLGQDPQTWQEWDVCELLSSGRRITGPGEEILPLLVDQGLADGFLEEQLRPQDLAAQPPAGLRPQLLLLLLHH